MSPRSRRRLKGDPTMLQRSTTSDRFDNVRFGNDSGPVLVAVDGDSLGWDSLAWAAAEAAARGSHLKIIHVFSWPLILDSSGALLSVWDAGGQEKAEQILNEAVQQARLVAPDLSISTRLQAGVRAEEVLREGRCDALIVVGRSRTRRHLPWLDRSMSDQIVRKAHGAVAAVGLNQLGPSGRARGRVLVGIDQTLDGKAALGFAFRAASRRRIGLPVLHTSVAISAQERRTMDHSAALQAFTTRAVRDALTAHQETFPHVSVMQVLRSESLSDALAAGSAGAALVVIGTSGSGTRHRVLAGASGRRFWRTVQSTVNIVQIPTRR